MADTFGILAERGYIADCSQPLDEVASLVNGRATLYQGFDPTASSLHVGSLLGLMALRHLQLAGHLIIFLVGGATAQVGDPSGRDYGRTMLPLRQIQANADAIRRQVQGMGLLAFDERQEGTGEALLLNNADWLNLRLPLYLREVAAHFSVNEMIRRDTFARRLDRQQNLSLLEFLYPTLQAFDFLHLFDKYDCRLQVGGTDQWGNVVDGIELVRRLRGERVHGLVFPLLLDRAGQKMGKTAAGETVWLDPGLTPVFSFYQYWLATADADLVRNLQLFTWLPMAEIEELVAADPRAAQHRLALEVTTLVHGGDEALQAERDAAAAFRGGATPQAVPTLRLAPAALEDGVSVAQALRLGGAVSSLGAARRLIFQGGVRVNGERLAGADRPLALPDFVERGGEAALVLQHGRGRVLKVVLAA